MYKIFKILVALLSLVGIVYLFLIIGKGDEGMKEAFANGDTSLFEPMALVAYIILGLTLALVVFFVLKGLFTNTSTLKSTLIGVGAFLLVGLLGYFMANGVETPMQDGKMLSASGSKWVGAGLYMFYFLAIIAIGTMLVTGVKKMIS